MACYFLAGKADDPAFARAVYAANLIESACPNVLFHVEMRHPDEWTDFIRAVLRKYDFHVYDDGFQGPLVWTREGNLVGDCNDFVNKICVDKFGIKKPPSTADPMFQQIAVENLRQVEFEQERARCLPFAERLDAAHAEASKAGLVVMRDFVERRKIAVHGVPWEVLVSAVPEPEPTADTDAFDVEGAEVPPAAEEVGAVDGSVAEGGAAELAEGVAGEAEALDELPLEDCVEVGEAAADDGVGAEDAAAEEDAAEEAVEETPADEPAPAEPVLLALDPALRFAAAGADPADGRLQSHSVLLHPRPTTRRQMVLVPKHLILEREAAEAEPAAMLVAPSTFGSDPDEDLGLQAFTAAMEVLKDVGGAAVWMGLRGVPEHRDIMDTHLQVLPFPIVEESNGEESMLRFPLELYIDRMRLYGMMLCFPFHHTLVDLDVDEEASSSDAARIALHAYEAARAERDAQGVMLAFTLNWLLLVPLRLPDPEHPRFEAWLRLPPPPPCALCGLVICPELRPDFPETAVPSGAGFQVMEPDPPVEDGGSAPVLPRRVSNRAEEEGIPEEAAEYAVAAREVRIDTRIMGEPISLLAHWACLHEEGGL